jgi:hypothetical protein
MCSSTGADINLLEFQKINCGGKEKELDQIIVELVTF